MFQTELVDESSYKANIDGIRVRLVKLQELDKKAQKIRIEGLNGYKILDKVLYHQELPFVPEIIWTKLISWYHNNPLAHHFGIDKTKDFVSRKYY